MIIYFSKNKQNQCAVQTLVTDRAQQVFYYHDEFELLLDESDDTLILLDLSADGVVQNFISPEIIAEKLKDTHVLSHIKKIKILISDILIAQPMSVFAWELSKSILELDSELSIPIIYIGKGREIPLLIEPPENSENSWTLYNLPSRGDAPLEIPEEIQQRVIPLPKKSYFVFFKEKMSHLLFKGDINSLFNIHGSEIEPEIVKKTYIR